VHGDNVILCAFELLELDGKDMRRAPIEERKAALVKLLRRLSDGIALNEHFTGGGAIIYKYAYALGCEGIVSKRLGSPYRPGGADCWAEGQEPGRAGGHSGARRSGTEDQRFLPVAVRCLRCRHEGSLLRAEFARFGLKLDAPIAAFMKRLRCSKCGSASVMARRVSRELVARPPRLRRRA
jgi:hypothetical protein